MKKINIQKNEGAKMEIKRIEKMKQRELREKLKSVIIGDRTEIRRDQIGIKASPKLSSRHLLSV